MLMSRMQLCTGHGYPYPTPHISHFCFSSLTSYEDMPVLEWACTFLSKFSSSRRRIQLQDLERLSETDVKLLRNILKGVRVTVSVPAGRRPARPIKDLVPNVGSYAFMKGDDETTIRVRSLIFVVDVSDRVPSGILRRKIQLQASIPEIVWHLRQRPAEDHRPRGNLHPCWWTDVQEGALARANVRGPATRNEKSAGADRSDRTRRQRRCEPPTSLIADTVLMSGQFLDYKNSPFFSQIGMQIDLRPMETPARLLQPPDIQYQGSIVDLSAQADKVSWVH
jgi:hypothetical protein